MDVDEPTCPSPSPSPSLYPRPPSSLLLKDISNFKTPKRPSQIPNFQSPCPQKFFTASKHTPKSSSSSFCRRGPPSVRSNKSSKSKTAAARRLRSLELEQSKSAYKSQLKKEQTLKSLSKSLTVWLNFLLENPKLCGCDKFDFSNVGSAVMGKGKREGGEVMTWRDPKRQRDTWWKGDNNVVEDEAVVWESKYSTLRNSLKDVCSLDDLKQRMRHYLSLSSCKEVFDIMSHVNKNIDEGRLKMKSHCPVVTDFGMKEKATSVLMCYNPVWLRIGLYVVFGGDSLLLNENLNSDQEMAFLKMIIEKQFFSHAGLAKAYAYNKKVEGLYRPGYYETLGNVILKRILLLVLILDKAKSESILPLKYGIDGVDGGSPLLFSIQSSIKSSRQVIVDFLSSEVMHGEGNLFAHLVIVGYKVSYQQFPLLEYDFRVTNLFVDLQDGVRLGRIIHLLLQESSILMKMIVPSDSYKKNLANCGIALHYLKKAGVKLYDEDGATIMEDDVANGDKELTLSLLWNMFVDLQLPLLISRKVLTEEICKIRGTSVDQLNSVDTVPLNVLLNWIQVICKKYDFCINDFSSLNDGKAIWCLLDFYFRKELCCSCSSKTLGARGEKSVVSTTDYTDAYHNIVLSQKLMMLLGNFPEVLQMSDILEHNGACSDKSVVILLVFLSSQLIVKKNMDQLNFHKLLGCNCQSPERRRWAVNFEALSNEEKDTGHNTEDAVRNFKTLQAWWQEMAEQNYKIASKRSCSSLPSSSTSKSNVDVKRATAVVMLPGNAAKVIQFHFRRWIERQNFLKIRNAISHLQIVIRAWLAFKHNTVFNTFNNRKEKWKKSELFRRYVKFIVERHHFVKLKRSVLRIQRATRIWISHRHQARRIELHGSPTLDLLSDNTDGQDCVHIVSEIDKALLHQEKGSNNLKLQAALKIQFAWRNFISSRFLQKNSFASTKIQSYFRCWLLRRRFLNQKEATLKIQSHFRGLRCWKAFQRYIVASRSAIIIQSYVRGWIVRRGAWKLRCLIVIIQRCFRGWLIRRDFLFQREAVAKIQSAVRSLKCWRAFHSHKHAATEVQRFVRGQIIRSRLLGSSGHRAATPRGSNFYTIRGCFWSVELEIFLTSVLKLQKWWKHVLLLKLKRKSAIIIQSHIRGWTARRKASREKHRISVLQSYWKGYLARKESSKQLLDLRLRVQKSAGNVDDGMRIINRLVSALSELLGMKSVRGILHTCSTLDMATEHSQRCCEKLVAAGAIDTLLKLIRSVSRSIPDQEVLKHTLSTLRNLSRYPHLIEVLLDCQGSVETILWELLRNKDEGYFIACEILKKMCSTRKGVDAICKLPAHLKRLNNLVEELTRKATLEKRNSRSVVVKENLERRLREAAELLNLIKHG